MLENFIDTISSFQAFKIRLPNPKHRQVPLLIMSNIINSFSQLQRPTMKISSGTLSLALNPGGVSMKFNSFPMMGMRVHLTQTPMLICFKHKPLIRNQVSQEFLRNDDIGCLRRKKLFVIKCQKQKMPPFWVMRKHPISLLPMKTFIVLPLGTS